MTNLSGDELTGAIIGAAIEVHRHLGPGLLESVYEECLAFELRDRRLAVGRQLELPVFTRIGDWMRAIESTCW